MAHILLIDDDPTLRSLLAGLLEAAGHRVVVAADGRGGVSLFAAGAIELVVTDILMPEQEGIGTIGAIRKLDASVPILAISGSDSIGSFGDYLRIAVALGATDTMVKPLSPDLFLATVERLLAARAH